MAATDAEAGTRLVVEFSGGLELLFGKRKRIEIALPNTFRVDRGEGSRPLAPTVRDAIAYIAEKECEERVELFMRNGSVTPGILVLLNGADWELEGELDAEVYDGDELAFISTLHGG